MMKIDEQNMQGGNSLLLYLDDWERLERFFSHPLARRVMDRGGPLRDTSRAGVLMRQHLLSPIPVIQKAMAEKTGPA